MNLNRRTIAITWSHEGRLLHGGVDLIYHRRTSEVLRPNDPRLSGGKSDSEIIAEAMKCLKVFADSKGVKGTTMTRESV